MIAAVAMVFFSCAAIAQPAPLSFVKETAAGLPGMYAGSFGTADFDGDGKIDVVMTGNYQRQFDSSDGKGGRDQVRLYKNISTPGGAIRFQFHHAISAYGGIRGSAVAVGDFNGDRKPDFAIEMRNGSDIAAFLNNGHFNFAKRIVKNGFGNNSNSLGMVAVDVDRNGSHDLVFNSDGAGTGPALWYSWSNAQNKWLPMQTNFSHVITYGGTLAAGDLNGDGYPEIAVGGNSNRPFGSHDCTGNLMYGETHLNLRGQGFDLPAMSVVAAFGYRVPAPRRKDINSCEGMDNAQMQIADLDLDGHNDVIIAGSSTGQSGRPGRNGQQYDFAVLFNRDGSGKNFQPWEHTGPQEPCGGTTNGGVGNVDFQSIAVGDLTNDRYPDVFIQGHRRDYFLKYNSDCSRNSNPPDPYVFEDIVFVNNRNRTFTAVPLKDYLPVFGANENLPGVLNFLRGRPRYVAEGGEAIADFNNDGKPDLIFSGAELPYHTNGINIQDFNSPATLKTYVLRNTK
jgi:hypothetical protein